MNISKIISGIAPTIATALGGPLAGGAVKLLSNVLTGKPTATEKEIADSFLLATSAQLEELREIDAQYKEKMLQANVDLEQIAASDRDSARKREISLKDKTPFLLAILTTVGFFGVLVGLFIYPAADTNQPINIMLGTLGTAWVAVITYYFGSSASSRHKDLLISEKNKTP